jgi:hypothetical protein
VGGHESKLKGKQLGIGMWKKERKRGIKRVKCSE